MRGAAWLFALVSGCALDERADLLVGRSCEPGRGVCDEGQACLPHELLGLTPTDFRCRDAASFERFGGAEPPLAYCRPEEGLACPEGIVCGAGRIRRDAGPRQRVCRAPGAAFGPPDPDGGR